MASSSVTNTSLFLLMEHPETVYFRNEDGRIKSPLEPNVYIFIFNCVCCLISFPANFRVTVLLIQSKRRLLARNVILIHLILSSVLTSITDMIAVIYYLWPIESLCCFSESIIGLSYVAFCFNMLISLIDHYVAITNPLWHRRQVTVRRAIIWPFVLNLILALSVKWMFINGTSLEICCAIQVMHFETVIAALIILCIFCFTFLVIVYLKTWKVLPRPSRTVKISRKQQLPSINKSCNPEREGNDFNAAIATTSDESARIERNAAERMSIHVGNDALSRMELEATKTFLIGAIPLLLLPIPGVIYSLSTIICLHLNGIETCGGMTSLVAYFERRPARVWRFGLA